jgi:hypothetical protein
MIKGTVYIRKKKRIYLKMMLGQMGSHLEKII